jgi:nucleotide-binding universal stress UspA family protein
MVSIGHDTVPYRRQSDRHGQSQTDELRSLLISGHANAVVRNSPVSVMVVR